MQDLFSKIYQQQQQQQQQQAPVSPDSAANICKSNGNLQKFQGELGGCRTGADNTRIQSFFSQLENVQGFFQDQFAQFNDTIALGDKFYGSAASSTVLTEVSQRNKDLQATLETLQKETKQLRASTERHERDFLDVKGALPERIPTQRLNVLDDYTMLLLTISFLMMGLSVVFYYAHKNNYTISSILVGTVGLAILSCIAYAVALIIL
jgi:hypothetical protein